MKDGVGPDGLDAQGEWRTIETESQRER